MTGTKLVMDQPQNVPKYFSKFPEPGYEKRTDLILTLDDSSSKSLTVQRAQTAVNLADANPEANETVNVFYAAEMVTGTLYEFGYTLEPAEQDFEQIHSGRRQGVVFVSQRSGSGARLYFLPLNDDLLPAGSPDPLTDGVITDPRRPAASADGRFIIFDADYYKPYHVSNETKQRIHTLDLSSAAVRRLTSDPFGASSDWGASLDHDGARFVMISNRDGSPRMVIASVASGQGGGFGNEVGQASSADWSHVRNEIAFADASRLKILDVDTEEVADLLYASGADSPRFSPSGDQIAFSVGTGLQVVNRDGTGSRPVAGGCFYPTWAGESHLIAQCSVSGNIDLYLIEVGGGSKTRLTTDPAEDREPTFVLATGPTPSHKIAISPSLKLLSWPLEPLPDAETALDEIESQGGNAPEVYCWLSKADIWDGYAKGLPFHNFSLELGQGYFVRAQESSTWARPGWPPETPVPVDLNPIWTLIGLPRLPEPMTAGDLVTDANGQGGACTEVARWETSVSDYQIFCPAWQRLLSYE